MSIVIEMFGFKEFAQRIGGNARRYISRIVFHSIQRKLYNGPFVLNNYGTNKSMRNHKYRADSVLWI